MENWISKAVLSTQVITPKPSHRRMRYAKFSQQLLNPHHLSCSIDKRLVLSFSA